MSTNSGAKNSVLLSCPFPLAIRNLVNSGLAGRIEEQLDCSVKIVSPYLGNELSCGSRKFRNYNIPASKDVGGVPQLVEASWIERAVRSVHLTSFAIRYPDASLQNIELSSRRGLAYKLAKISEICFPKGTGRRKTIGQLARKINFSKRSIREVFSEVNPDCVIVVSPGHYWLDYHVISEAKRRSIPSICIVLSWDNLYSRGPLCQTPDLLMVWSDEMKSQAVNVHSFPSDKISVVGALQFRYYDKQPSPREVSDVRKGLGLGTDTPYIAYVCGARTVHYDIEDVLNLKKVLSKSKYSNVHIVLRPHPQALKTEYQKLINLGIIVDFNLDVLSGDPAVFDRKSMEYMAAFLSGAQFVISSWGTTALLEACIFQRPSIQLRWMDSVVHTNTSEVLMVKNFQRYIHMRAFDEEGARLYSDSPETLIATMEKLESMEDHFNQKRFNAVKRIVKTPLGDVLNRVIEVVEAVGNQRFIKQ